MTCIVHCHCAAPLECFWNSHVYIFVYATFNISVKYIYKYVAENEMANTEHSMLDFRFSPSCFTLGFLPSLSFFSYIVNSLNGPIVYICVRVCSFLLLTKGKNINIIFFAPEQQSPLCLEQAAINGGIVVLTHSLYLYLTHAHTLSWILFCLNIRCMPRQMSANMSMFAP